MAYTAIALLLVLSFASLSEASETESVERIGVCSCDNPEMTDKPCRSSSDADYMIIRVFDKPNGAEIARVEDQGVGFCAEQLSTVVADDGEKWLLLAAGSQLRGFVRASSTITMKECGLPLKYQNPVVISPDPGATK